MLPRETLQLHHRAEGEATEGDGGAAGNGWGFPLPDVPPGGTQTPPPALQAVRLCIHKWVSAVLAALSRLHHKSN